MGRSVGESKLKEKLPKKKKSRFFELFKMKVFVRMGDERGYGTNNNQFYNL